jgi:glycerate kinase
MTTSGMLPVFLNNKPGKDVEKIPGAGAAGGLGAGLLAFTGAIIQSGFEVISKENDFENHIQWADLIITGEGKIDSQTQFGKTPAGVAKVAKKYGKPVIAIAGTLGEGYMELYPRVLMQLLFYDKPMSLHEAIIKAPQLLERCAYNIVRLAIKCIVS